MRNNGIQPFKGSQTFERSGNAAYEVADPVNRAIRLCGLGQGVVNAE